MGLLKTWTNINSHDLKTYKHNVSSKQTEDKELNLAFLRGFYGTDTIWRDSKIKTSWIPIVKTHVRSVGIY